MRKINGPYIYIDYQTNHLEVNLSIRTSTRDSWHFAECPELQMMDQGKSRREAIENLHDMVFISLLEAIETKNIDGMLKELGFGKRNLPVHDKFCYKGENKLYSDLYPLSFLRFLLL